MSVSEAKRTHKSEDVRRREILETAARLFAANGYRPTDVQAIADEANVGKGTIYRLFPAKEALFSASVEHVMVRLSEEVETALAPHEGDPHAQIVASLKACLAFFDRHPDYVELFMQERAEFRERAKPIYFTYRRANIERWRNIWEEAMRCGAVRRMPVDTVMNFMSDLFYGAIMANRVDPRGKSLSEQADGMLEIVFNGIAPPAAGRGGIRQDGNTFPAFEAGNGRES